MTTSSGTILFVVSPNLGIVDLWLPILVELKRRNAHNKIVAFFPEEHILARVRDGDLLTELSHALFDSTICRDVRGSWSANADFKRAAARLVGGSNGGALWAFGKRALAGLGIREWSAPESRSTSLPVNLLPSSVDAVLFDIASEKRDLVRLLQETVYSSAAWFSLPHGIDLRTVYLDNKLSAHSINKVRRPSVTAYVASSQEVESYREAYGLDRKSIKVVGVPRHAKSWIENVLGRYDKELRPKPPYILLISRPKSSKYFPRERKLQALRDIKKLADSLCCNIVVRRHPNESDDGLFAAEFGEYGTNWSFTVLHPFALGFDAMFCITFFSSVAVDMVALGIPVIERQDFRGLSTFTGLEDSEGNQISTYQKSGLVLGARNHAELQAHASKIVSRRQEVVAMAKGAYDRLYATMPDSIGLIADEIEHSFRRSAREREKGAALREALRSRP